MLFWGSPTHGGGHWAGDMALAVTAWQDGLPDLPCPVPSLPTGHRDSLVSVGHPPVPNLRMPGAGTALNELLSSPLGEWGVLGVSGPEKGVGPCFLSTCPADIFFRSTLAHGQIRIRDPNQGGKDITEEIMSGARTSSTPTPPQVTAPPDSATEAAEVHGALLNPLFASSGWKRFGASGQWRNPPCSSYCQAR